MIQLSHAGKRFGPKLLFEDLDWLITPHDRIGLVGANGTGKSTLLKILGGMETLEYGSISIAKGIKAGYLPQDGLTLSGRTVFGECLSVFDELFQMEREMETLTRQMAEFDPESDEFNRISERYHGLESQFHTQDGYALEGQVGAVLNGLGFSRSDWNRRTEEFSGGWQMRIALAKLLLEKPNLLLLDEPTNHLDLEARNWLEQYLGSYPHAFVLISHDRYFLDVTVSEMIEIWNHKVNFYSGNYDKYLRQKGERQAQLEAAFRNQQQKIQQLETFISRFRYQATKAKQVQSRIKELERMEKIELETEEKTIHFSFPQPVASGRMVAEFERVAKSYGEHLVFRDVNLVIHRGERIALVGPNGAGKSTLLKLLAGIEPLSAGEYRIGHNVNREYFAQDQYKELNAERNLFEDLSSIAPRVAQTELRGLLGCFLFSGDDAFKRIGVLSGGERNRYALARILLQPANFLLLDEPTNHLDLRAKDVLLEALQEYTGTVVFVSHDRYFIDKLATRIFEIGGGEVHDYAGNYEDYRAYKEGRQPELSAEVPVPAVHQPVGLDEDELAPKTKRLNPIRLQQMKDRCLEIEEEVARCEAEMAAYAGELANFKSGEEALHLSQRIRQCQKNVDQLMKEWEDVAQLIESSQ